jgi:hypothetical protein
MPEMNVETESGEIECECECKCEIAQVRECVRERCVETEKSVEETVVG